MPANPEGNVLMTERADARARAMAFVFLPLAGLYFAWLLQPERIGNPVLYGVLVVAELFNLAQAIGFWWTCTYDHIRAPAPGVFLRDPVVDVLIPVYDEPIDIVEPTIAAARAMHSAQVRVALLDDGDSPEMEELARRHGVAYIRRSSHSGAKAGNLNHALLQTSAPFVAIFDCDHVPSGEFLAKTLPAFTDEAVAFVQTPQYYANAPRAGGVCEAAWAQQALFFGPIGRGKDGMGAMFCCGTNMVFRRSSLEAIGGFPEEALTEDFEMSIDLHERGLTSVYIPEVLARGLGPEDMASYVGQQHRWARGCLSTIPKIFRARLAPRLRLQYLLSAMFFLTGWSVLVYVTLPVARLVTGAQPLAEASADQFLLHFAPYFGMALLAVSLFGRGLYSYDGFALMSASFWVHVRALLGLILRRPSKFMVTPKRGSGSRQPRAVAPTLLTIAVLVCASAFGLARDRDPATWNNVAFAMMHAALLTTGAWPALTRTRRTAGADPRVEMPAREPARTHPRAEGRAHEELVESLGARVDKVLGGLFEPGARCALLDFPNHSNCGDSAIWLGETKALERRGASIVSASDSRSFSASRVAQDVGSGTIVLHGGGNLGDLYPASQRFREEVIAAFPFNRIIQLPQSIQFRDPASLEHARRVFDSHPDFTLLVRDERSLALAEEHFDVPTVLCPDMALALGNLDRPVKAAQDVTWLSRTDHESRGETPLQLDGIRPVDWLSPVSPQSHLSFGSQAAARAATRAAGRLGARYAQGGPDLRGIYDRIAHRNVLRGARILARGRVVLTDRLHGHLLSLMLGIPHVVMGDAHGKVRGFFDAWTHDSGISWWAEGPEEGLELARGLAREPGDRTAERTLA